jgi:ribosome maturation factor RimP
VDGVFRRRVGASPPFFVDEIMNEEQKQVLAEVEQAARDLAAMQGLEIVEFIFRSQGRHSLLRIDIDRPGVPGVGIADCEMFSRAFGDRIEDLPFFHAPYELQVSSPGIDRPIRTDDDLRRNIGRRVWTEFRDEKGTVREVRGTLVGGCGLDAVTLVTEQGESQIGRDRIVLIRQDVTVGGRHRSEP